MAKEVLVKFVADVNSHCVGDVVRLTAEEKAETDEMAERFGIETAYEVVEETKAEAVESKGADGAETPAVEPAEDKAETKTPAVEPAEDKAETEKPANKKK